MQLLLSLYAQLLVSLAMRMPDHWMQRWIGREPISCPSRSMWICRGCLVSSNSYFDVVEDYEHYAAHATLHEVNFDSLVSNSALTTIVVAEGSMKQREREKKKQHKQQPRQEIAIRCLKTSWHCSHFQIDVIMLYYWQFASIHCSQIIIAENQCIFDHSHRKNWKNKHNTEKRQNKQERLRETVWMDANDAEKNHFSCCGCRWVNEFRSTQQSCETFFPLFTFHFALPIQLKRSDENSIVFFSRGNGKATNASTERRLHSWSAIDMNSNSHLIASSNSLQANWNWSHWRQSGNIYCSLMRSSSKDQFLAMAANRADAFMVEQNTQLRVHTLISAQPISLDTRMLFQRAIQLCTRDRTLQQSFRLP